MHRACGNILRLAAFVEDFLGVGCVELIHLIIKGDGRKRTGVASVDAMFLLSRVCRDRCDWMELAAQ